MRQDQHTNHQSIARDQPSQDGREHRELFFSDLTGTYPGPFGFGISAAGTTLAIDIDGPVLVKPLPPATYIEIAGGGRVTAAAARTSTVVFPFDGFVDYCALRSPLPTGRWTACDILPRDSVVSHAICASANHRMTLAKR